MFVTSPVLDFISRKNPESFQFIHSPSVKRDVHFSELVFGDSVVVVVEVVVGVVVGVVVEVVQ